MWGDGGKIYPEEIISWHFLLDTSDAYNRFFYLEDNLKLPHLYPPKYKFQRRYRTRVKNYRYTSSKY